MAIAANKTIDFSGKAGEYFVVAIVTGIGSYVPFFGWAFALNFAAGWVVNNLSISGKKLKYQATYMEALKFIFINTLLLIITFGIYVFWFVPKMYRFIAAHSDFEGATPAPAAPTSTPVAVPATPAADTTAKPPSNLVQ